MRNVEHCSLCRLKLCCDAASALLVLKTRHSIDIRNNWKISIFPKYEVERTDYRIRVNAAVSCFAQCGYIYGVIFSFALCTGISSAPSGHTLTIIQRNTRFTSSINFEPRSNSFVNIPNDVAPGEKRMTSFASRSSSAHSFALSAPSSSPRES